MNTRTELVKLLSDGVFHSGTDLGKKLGITRAAVCKSIRKLTQSGLDVHRVTGRGYKLDAPLTLLDRSRILKHLGSAAADFRDRVHVLEEVDSTNRHLAELMTHAKIINGMTCLAEAQSGGRGRRGRAWIATPYHNVLLSMGWRFASGPGIVSGLSLAAGVALARALEAYGVRGVGLKWPNDVLWKEKKLAGLLVDVQGEASGPCLAVLGVGVNGFLNERDAARIDQPWTDLFSITGATVDRNRLAALIIRELWRMFEVFAAKGLAAFRDEWQRRHLYHGRRVRLFAGEREVAGTVEGIDAHGALLLRNARGGTQAFHSGEISLRAVAG